MKTVTIIGESIRILYGEHAPRMYEMIQFDDGSIYIRKYLIGTGFSTQYRYPETKEEKELINWYSEKIKNETR